MNVTTIAEKQPMVAPDKSEIRAFASPECGDLQKLSIAEITLAPGLEVPRHFHRQTEEVYHLLKGSAEMYLDGETQTLCAGQAVTIPVGKVHGIRNHDTTPLVMAVTCSPPWSPEDQFEAE